MSEVSRVSSSRKWYSRMDFMSTGWEKNTSGEMPMEARARVKACGVFRVWVVQGWAQGVGLGLGVD